MKLGELIEARRTDLGGSRGPLKLRELQEKARAAGYTLADTTIAAFVNHPLPRVPKDETIEGLAVALDLDFDTVLAACMESKRRGSSNGELTEVADTAHVRAFAELTEARTPAQREAMLDLVRSIAAGLDAALGQESGSASAVTNHDDSDSDPPHLLRDVTS